jgi:cytochrome c553
MTQDLRIKNIPQKRRKQPMNTLKFLVMVAVSVTVFWGTDWAAAKEKTGSPENGKILYNKLRCYYCHKIGNEGGNTGPDLTKEGAKKRGVEWQMKNLADPSSTHLKHPENMPKFDKLTEKMFLDLAAYLESLK